MPEETNLTERKLIRDLMTVGVPTCPPTTPLVAETVITGDRVVASGVRGGVI